jgi:DNA-binding transcriptional LysR family regulator
MDIKQLQYFVVSVDMGSFHAASQVLITTQPNVSKIVKSLEEELQMVLLKRTRNGVTITQEGEKIYQYAIEILKNMKMIRELKDTQGVEKLSICAMPSNRLAVSLSEFYNLSTDINMQMDFWEGDVEDIITRVHRRDSEIGFVYISNRNISAFLSQMKSKGLHFEVLKELPLCVFVGSRHELYESKTISEEELSKLKMVQFYEKQYSLHSHLGHLKDDIVYGGEDAEVAYTNSNHLVNQLLMNTDYCMIGTSFIREEYQDMGIRAIPIAGSENTVTFGYIRRMKNDLSPIASSFIAFLEKHYIK